MINKPAASLRIALLVGLAAAVSTVARAQNAVALTANNALISFTVGTAPTEAPVTITGLNGGEALVGIDYRPINRALIGLTSQGRLVTLNPATGAATALSTLSAPLQGTAFGVDFNPVPDRLRVVTNTGLNYRINVDNGAVTVDGALRYDAADAGASTSGAPAVAGAAYTNSVAGRLGTTTALYNIDSARDTLVLQNPPNDGVLRTVGPLGVDVSAVSGFDIFSPNWGYASFVVGGQVGLYRINLATGAATFVHALPAGVIDIAIAPKEPAQAIVNTSARGMVAAGEGALLSGFVVEGTAPVNVLVIARGPSLVQFGVTNALTDTRLLVYRGSSLLEQNDDWQANPRSAEITATGFAPMNARESAALLTLTPGTYTAMVAGGGNATTGVAIVEVYELP